MMNVSNFETSIEKYLRLLLTRSCLHSDGNFRLARLTRSLYHPNNKRRRRFRAFLISASVSFFKFYPRILLKDSEPQVSKLAL